MPPQRGILRADREGAVRADHSGADGCRSVEQRHGRARLARAGEGGRRVGDGSAPARDDRTAGGAVSIVIARAGDDALVWPAVSVAVAVRA